MPVKFGQRLKKLRIDKNCTQEEIADALGCATPRISEWERSVRVPKPLTQEGILARIKKVKKKKVKSK